MNWIKLKLNKLIMIDNYYYIYKNNYVLGWYKYNFAIWKLI